MLQWRGPYKITEVVNRMDYKVEVDGKTKIYHVNLLKKYFDREVDLAGMALESTECMAGVSVLDVEEDENIPSEEDKDLLELPPVGGNETYRDVNISEDLPPSKINEVQKLLEEYADIFTDRPGETKLEHHNIQLMTDLPVRVKPYRMPYTTREIIRTEVEAMLEAGIIEPSNSAYGSPVVLVRKKDGSNRFCIDYRKLNQVTKFDSEPMGNPEDMMAQLDGKRFFTKIDLSKGYWQIPMDEESKEKTAFITPDGCYQFRRMPFGLVNSAATFNRMMRKMLTKCADISHYVDDILAHTVTWKDHVTKLRELFNKIRNAGLTVRPSKCYIGYHRVDFVGHVIGDRQIAMEEEKVARIQDAPAPSTKRQVRSFLGLAGYYRKFIPRYAEVAAPLTDLTKKGQPNTVKWEEPQQKAFDQLKQMLASAPILRMPDFTKVFIVQADASDVGLGAVLLQKHESEIFPVMYASKKLLPREKNYSVIERECLALIFAIKKFQNYIYGTEFIVQTDHQPLAYIQRCKIDSSRIMRWALYLQNYRFHIEAIKGKDNVGADCLSRLC
jgi:hypothetical protein